MIRFGWLSFVLAAGAIQGAVVAALLGSREKNRQANLLLAALIVAFVLRLVPYIIGYAGFYDAYPWLSFAPFALTLAYGPIVYLYVTRITAGGMPRRWWWHFVPAALQLAYYLAVFAQPVGFKHWFDRAVHVPYVDPLESALTFVSLIAYLAAATRRYAAYRQRLLARTSDAERHGLSWLRTFMVAFGLTIAINAAFEVVGRFVRPLNYFDRFSLYVWYAALSTIWRSRAGATPPTPLRNRTTSGSAGLVSASVNRPTFALQR